MKASKFIPADALLEKHGPDVAILTSHSSIQPTTKPSSLSLIHPATTCPEESWVSTRAPSVALGWMSHECGNALQSLGVNQQSARSENFCCAMNHDCFGSRWKAMNAKLTEQIFSDTRCQMIDAVCNKPEKHPMPSCPPGTDRKYLFLTCKSFVPQ
jgi:hypothetical protein